MRAGIGFLIASFVVCAMLVASSPAAQAIDEPIVVVAHLYVTPGQEMAYEERARKIIAFVRKAEPSTIFRLQRSVKEPSVFVWYEVYASQTAFDHHTNVVLPAATKEFGPRPEGMLARPTDIERLSSVEP